MSKRYSYARNALRLNRDVRTRTGPIHRNTPAKGTDQGDATQQHAEANLSADTSVADTLAKLLSHTDGWARFIPDHEHKALFLKWKWNRGSYQGQYVMSVVPPWQLHLGLEILLGKVEDVEAGVRTPTKDTPYDE
jgi:hypothetical protein